MGGWGEGRGEELRMKCEWEAVGRSSSGGFFLYMGYKCFSQPSFQEILLSSSLRELLHECGSEAQVVDFFLYIMGCKCFVRNLHFERDYYHHNH